MKTIILYSSKHGATKEIALQLANDGPKYVVKDINEFNESPDNYDCIIIGASIYVGNLSKKVVTLCKEATTCKLLLFLSGLAKEKWQETLQTNIPNYQQIFTYTCFIGGKLNFLDMGFMERTMIKMINKKMHLMDSIDMKKTYDFIEYQEVENLKKEIQTLDK